MLLLLLLLPLLYREVLTLQKLGFLKSQPLASERAHLESYSQFVLICYNTYQHLGVHILGSECWRNILELSKAKLLMLWIIDLACVMDN